MTPLLSVLLFKYRKDAYKRFFHSRFCRWALKSLFVAYRTAFYPESRNIALNAQVNHALALRTKQLHNIQRLKTLCLERASFPHARH